MGMMFPEGKWTGRVMDWDIWDSAEPKLDRWNRFGRKVVILNVFGVDETIARTGVNQGRKTKDSNDWRTVGLCTGADFKEEWYSEWMIGKSSSVEGDNLQCVITVNTTLILHRGYRLPSSFLALLELDPQRQEQDLQLLQHSDEAGDGHLWN